MNKEKKNIYVASGIVRVQMNKATKHKTAYWVEKKFEGAVVSGIDEEEARTKLTSLKVFVGKEYDWLRKKKIQIIKVNFKFLSKANHY